MPVVDRNEASDVDELIGRALTAPSTADTVAVLRRLFVEKLDFNPASGTVVLADSALPPEASRLASRDGVQVVAVQFPHADRLRTRDLRNTLKALGQTLTGEILLAATDAARSRIDFVYPDLKDGRDILRRMVVRRDEPRRTVSQQIAGIYHEMQGGASVQTALSRTYDVEAVTRRFFVEYKRVFDRVMALVEGIPDENERRLFCQTLFNRLMFLYFLQRKGWLTFNGSAEYLEELWASRLPEENFYDVRLKLLFFTALSNTDSRAPKLDDYTDHLIGRVPFLNGGLFEEKDIDKGQSVVVPDEAIGLILNQLFRHFNFTIQESTPYDVEVAVDPEMLGKVFEELVTGRHETGSYYTPRPIVSFMCREGLKGYLTSALTAARVDATPSGAGRDVAAFVDEHRIDGLSVSDARAILEALESVTVLDPACGSGAYLLGMLHELVELQSLLYASILLRDARSLHQLKLRIIERNLYGADIDPFAVNIAMLRLWLSLAIEFNSVSAPPPLPNLDFKIVCGDSLSAADPSVSHQLSFAHDVALQLASLKAEHMRAVGDEKRVKACEIRQKHEELVTLLGGDRAPSNAVDWRIQFAEVFDKRGGFDIVVANPPYVRHELITDQKPRLRQVYGPLFVGTADLFVYFYYRALQLLGSNGCLAFISSNKWLRAAYGARLRDVLEQQTWVRCIIDFGDLPVFETATAYPLIIIGQRGPIYRPTLYARVRSLTPPYPEVREILRRSSKKSPITIFISTV
jgi:hypothetical protein